MEVEEFPATLNVVKKKVVSRLSVIVISDESDFDAISNEWNKLVDVADAHIFQTFEWQRTWWEFFGGNNRLHILLFWDNGQLVGIMPMFLDHFTVLGIPVYRCLRMLGARVIQPVGGSFPVELAFSDYLSMIVYPGYEQKVNTALAEYLRSHTDLYDEIIFEEVPPESLLFSSLVPQFEQSEWSYTIDEASVCPQIQLPETWNDFLKDLSSSARYQIRRFVRGIEEENLFELRTARTDEEVDRAFHNLVELHQRRWRNLGQPGIFADKRIHDFFKEITIRFHQKGWLLFKTLVAEGECVAVDLLFQFKDIVYLVQRGFDDSSPYRKYSPGSILLYCVIKEAIEDGLKTYDFLRGEEQYKLRTATHTPQNKEIVIQNPKAKKRGRTRLSQSVRNYAYLKRKLRNERHMIGVYLRKNNLSGGLGVYFKNLYKRGARTLGQSC